MSETAKLTRGSIRGHLVTQTLPMMIGVAAIMSIGLIDAYFIGKLGSAQLAAISFVFPVTVAISSLGVGVMVGVNSVVARALGAGEPERATRLASFGILFALALGCVLGVAAFLLIDPLFALMQASDDLRPLIATYMAPFSIGIPLLLLQMAFSGVLRGQGEANKTSIVSISYAAANWALDPLLIHGAFGFEGFGMAGAAYATIVGWLMAAVLGWVMIRRARIHPSLDALRGCTFGPSLMALIRVAGPAAFSNAINPIGLSVLTSLVAIEGQAAVAGFGAAGRLQSFAVVPLLGLSGSIGAIVGQNWGACRADRSRRAFLYAGGFSLAYGLSIALLLVFASPWFAGFFTDDPDVVEQFSSYLSIAAWGYGGYGLLIIGNGALNAVDHSRFALAQSFARVFLFMLPFAWLLRESWGAEAIYAAELAANVAGGALAAFVAWRLLHAPGHEAGSGKPSTT